MRNGTPVIAYINGVQELPAVLANSSLDTSGILLGQRYMGAWGLNFHGRIDEVKCWNGPGEQQTLLHIMDDQKRIASKVSGDLMGQFEEVQYFLDDHLGSSSVVLNSNGLELNREEYYPFGETSFGSFAKKRYRFCGKERDEESGLYYYGARYYAPWICRFVSVDALAHETPFFSPFAYADDNPLMNNDPTGNSTEKASGDGGGGQTSNKTSKSGGGETASKSAPDSVTGATPQKTLRVFIFSETNDDGSQEVDQEIIKAIAEENHKIFSRQGYDCIEVIPTTKEAVAPYFNELSSRKQVEDLGFNYVSDAFVQIRGRENEAAGAGGTRMGYGVFNSGNIEYIPMTLNLYVNYKPSSANAIYQAAYGSAHEALHQFLFRAAFYLYGEQESTRYNVEGDKEHTDTPPNLNTAAGSLKEEPSPQKTYLERILPEHKDFLNRLNSIASLKGTQLNQWLNNRNKYSHRIVVPR